MEDKYINKLSTEVSEFIRASAAIASCSAIVEELLLNALDAASTKIEIYVDIAGYLIKVVDNGVPLLRIRFRGFLNLISESIQEEE